MIVIVSGRRYFSNAAYAELLSRTASPVAEIKLRNTAAARIYQLDEGTVAKIAEILK
jgi:hypothetical protein